MIKTNKKNKAIGLKGWKLVTLKAGFWELLFLFVAVFYAFD